MQNYRGFLAWLFQGWYKNLTLWGLIVAASGLLVLYIEIGLITAWLLLSVGLGLIMFDLAWSFLGFQYSLYVMERNRVSRELERK